MKTFYELEFAGLKLSDLDKSELICPISKETYAEFLRVGFLPLTVNDGDGDESRRLVDGLMKKSLMPLLSEFMNLYPNLFAIVQYPLRDKPENYTFMNMNASTRSTDLVLDRTKEGKTLRTYEYTQYSEDWIRHVLQFASI